MVAIAELKARLIEVKKLLECTPTIPREELLTLLANPTLVQVRAETSVNQLKQFLLDSDTQFSNVARLAILLHLLSKKVSTLPAKTIISEQDDPATFIIDLNGIKPKYSGPNDELDLFHQALTAVSALPITHLNLANNELGITFKKAVIASVAYQKFERIFEAINLIMSSGDDKSNKLVDLSNNELDRVELNYLLALISAINKTKYSLRLDLSGNKIELVIIGWMNKFEVQKPNVTIAWKANQFAYDRLESVSPQTLQHKSPWNSFTIALNTYLSEYNNTYTNPSLDQTLFTLANIKYETPVELSELCRLALILYVIILNLAELYKATQPELLQIVSRLNDGLQPITPYVTSSNSGSPLTTSTSSLTTSSSSFFSHSPTSAPTTPTQHSIQDFEDSGIQRYIAKLWGEMRAIFNNTELDLATVSILEELSSATIVTGYIATPR